MIQRHFPVGELGTTSILIAHPELDFRSDAGRAALDRVSQKLAAIPNVAEVRKGRWLSPGEKSVVLGGTAAAPFIYTLF